MPTFLIVGAQKAGTTSLWQYLRTHEQVFLPDEKEPGFFAEEFGWANGVGWYRALFAGSGDCRAVGEASTYYTMYPFFSGVPKRIAALLPDVRIIYLMRNPTERMRSSYVQHLADGRERRSMRDALLLDSGYLYLSRYALQIRQYYDHFPQSHILLLTAEERRSHRSATMDRVLAFLGLSESAPMDTRREYNQSDGKRAPRAAGRLGLGLARRGNVHPVVRQAAVRTLRSGLATRPISASEITMDADLRRRLVDLVRPDVELLRHWVGSSFTGWGLLTPEERQFDIPPDRGSTSAGDSSNRLSGE